MATTAQICSQFTIGVTLDGASAHVLTNPGRTFRVIEIAAFNAAGTPNITVAGAADIAATQVTVTNGWKSLTLTEANCNVASTQALTITNAATSTTKVLIKCVAGEPTPGGESLTIT
tara:strand:+ start:382 stop:732 length:351 start_codon:yes stop_codon:yes gene_type:complete